ncbi:MAG: dephospho-CoA kinase, partial [Clostridiales bacterium]|nr:dephospho-CoA kinase [Clostridiales bacterium]
MILVAITGGIASGKTLVSDRLRELGAAVIDADIVSREVMSKGQPGAAAVREFFGEEYIAESGGVDRRKLRGLVFGNAYQLSVLNSLMH